MPIDKHTVLQELLVLRCKRGDRAAFDALIREWEDRLFYFIRRLVATEEDAWDVLQQTWLKVYRGIKSLDDPQRLPTWLYQIARHTALSHWRGHYRMNAHRADKADFNGVAAADEDIHFENAEEVHLGLSRISLAHREVLTLHFLDDLSLDQIAEVLDIPSGTVKSRLYYAKRALQAAIQATEGSHE